jgi:hypothetical protein
LPKVAGILQSLITTYPSKPLREPESKEISLFYCCTGSNAPNPFAVDSVASKRKIIIQIYNEYKKGVRCDSKIVRFDFEIVPFAFQIVRYDVEIVHYDQENTV